jgi:hypothetical protein
VTTDSIEPFTSFLAELPSSYLSAEDFWWSESLAKLLPEVFKDI